MASQIFRKLKLLDEAELNRLIEKRLRDYNPQLSSLAKTQAELDLTLQAPNLTPEEKIALFQANQQRFKTLHEPIRISQPPSAVASGSSSSSASNYSQQPLLLNSPSSSKEISPVADIPEDHSLKDSSNVAYEFENTHDNDQSFSSPIAFHTRASSSTTSKTVNVNPNIAKRHQAKYDRLNELLSHYPEKLKLEPQTGEVVIEGVAQHGSNFADLISNLYAHHASHNLTGVNKFLETLNSIITSPREYVLPSSVISNKKILNSLHVSSPISSKNQTGKGKKKRLQSNFHSLISAHPPGKKVKVLYLYHM